MLKFIYYKFLKIQNNIANILYQIIIVYSLFFKKFLLVKYVRLKINNFLETILNTTKVYSNYVATREEYLNYLKKYFMSTYY